MKIRFFLLLPFLLVALGQSLSGQETSETFKEARKFTDALLRMTVVEGHCEVPFGFYPDFAASELGPVPQPQFELKNAEQIESVGRRAERLLIRQKIQDERYVMSRVYSPLLKHAREHRGRGPKSFDQVKLEEHAKDFHEHNKHRYFLIPEVDFHLKERDDGSTYADWQEAEKLMVQLDPYVDDGKHWVLYTSGNVRRVEIDEELMDKHDLELDIRRSFETEREQLPKAEFKILALYNKPGEDTEATEEKAEIIFVNPLTGERVSRVWVPGTAIEGEKLMLPAGPTSARTSGKAIPI